MTMDNNYDPNRFMRMDEDTGWGLPIALLVVFALLVGGLLIYANRGDTTQTAAREPPAVETKVPANPAAPAPPSTAPRPLPQQ
jgi:hypothetical protein